ncbi:MAG: hypothetical protein JSV15_01725 [Candidatus Bathyarchaeota archaeon]|nr:MAG: hypothetical protein JSV15_01725 [Candidatus Bathyarchaeota archaeon]
MERLALKMKLAVLWLFVAVSMTAGSVIFFMVPGVMEEIMEGAILGMQIGQELLLAMAVMYFWIPLVMAVLSLTLKDKVNRWANIILGIVYIGFVLVELISNILTAAYPYAILMSTSAFVVAALITSYAFKWPIQKA